MSNEAITWAYRQTLDSGAKFVLVVLADMADEAHSCYPGQARIAAMTGQGERTVRRHLLDLEALGLLERKVRRDEQGHRTSDRYVLPVGTDAPTGQNGHQESPAYRPKTTAPTGQNGQVTQRSTNPKKKELKNLPSSGQFGQFWEAYPRKVGKREAERKFEIAARTVDVAVIIDGARRYAASRLGQSVEYTKHPATWLHQGCWDDAPTANGRAEDKDPDWAPWL